MVKQRERSELEHLRSLIRKLQAENKSLRKQLARANKHARRFDESDDSLDISEDKRPEHQEDLFLCPKCHQPYKPKTIGSRMLHFCKECNWKKSNSI